MLINISNHPSSRWDVKQTEAAHKLGGRRIIDLPFPQVDPAASTKDIEGLAANLMSQIWDIIKDNMTTTDTESDDFESVVVHVMGEQTLCWHLLAQLKDRRIPAVASTTERKVEEKDGVKTSVFQFVQFRHYFGGSQWHVATAVENERQQCAAEQKRLSDFEIIGIDRYVEDNPNYGKRFTINNKEIYARVLIKHKKPDIAKKEEAGLSGWA